jgi:hypothetical protein
MAPGCARAALAVSSVPQGTPAQCCLTSSAAACGFVFASFVGTDELIKEAGADAEGLVTTQVVPIYSVTDLKTVALAIVAPRRITCPIQSQISCVWKDSWMQW